MKTTFPQIEVLRDSGALAEAAAECFIASAAEAIRSSGRFTIALSGGSTPKKLYALLAERPYASRVDWSRVQVFWSDERCVPSTDPMSNYLMARETLLSRVRVKYENIHRIRGEDDPAEAAKAYELELRQTFAVAQGIPESGSLFHLVLLGMGVDGHTASLFPGSRAVSENERWVMEHHSPAAPAWRVTFTPALINTSAQVLFLVSGRDKAAALRNVLEGPYLPNKFPAQAIAPRGSGARWIVDSAAAAEIRRT